MTLPILGASIGKRMLHRFQLYFDSVHYCGFINQSLK